MSFATIDSLRESLAQPTLSGRSPEYVAKMVHEVPDAAVVDRVEFILSRCKDKTVLHVGASGALHEKIVATSQFCFGIDKDDGDNIIGFDLDKVGGFLPIIEGVEVVICGEVIEHLSNPGHFLDRLHNSYPGVPVVVTVPNAFSSFARDHMRNGIENVNVDHVCWYSWRTLKTLVERSGYKISEHYWYNGSPGFAEGLVFVLE